MFKIAQTFAGAATLVLAALPAAALSTAAHASPYVVKVSDLNLGTADGQKTLDQRIGDTARIYCRNHDTTTGGRASARHACMSGVRAEVSEKAARIGQVTLAVR